MRAPIRMHHKPHPRAKQIYCIHGGEKAPTKRKSKSGWPTLNPKPYPDLQVHAACWLGAEEPSDPTCGRGSDCHEPVSPQGSSSSYAGAQVQQYMCGSTCTAVYVQQCRCSSYAGARMSAGSDASLRLKVLSGSRFSLAQGSDHTQRVLQRAQ